MPKRLKIVLLGFLVLVYVSGAIGFFVNPSFFSPYTSITLILTCLVFLSHQPLKQPAYIFSFFCLAAVGFAIEIIGVETGIIFGNYQYGNSLGTKFENVPLIISFNWAFLINAGVLLAAYFTRHRILMSLLSALIVVAVDVCMEQVAPLMDMWYFKGGVAGLHNYVAWFCITFVASFVLHENFKNGDRKIALIILVLQLITFGSVYLSKFFNFI